MLPFKKIIFPVDYSTSCQAIVPYVKDLTQHFTAELTVVHAYGPGALAYSEIMLADPKWPEEVQGLEEKRLRDFAGETFPGQHVEVIVEPGEPGTAIHEVVKRQGADLVMMPTHGHGPLRRLLLGSVTAKVLHDVSAAVWTGTGAALEEHEPGLPYRSIVCGLDDTDEAEAVLKAAAAFACSYGADLFLLRGVPAPPMALEVDYYAYRKDLMDAADLQLRELKESLGIKAPHKVIDAMVIDAIRLEAVARKADLVILGRGEAQGTFSRMWSLLYPIVRESPCPVLSI